MFTLPLVIGLVLFSLTRMGFLYKVAPWQLCSKALRHAVPHVVSGRAGVLLCCLITDLVSFSGVLFSLASLSS